MWKYKDLLDCRSYRQIILIGRESSILGEILAVRLNKVITNLIQPNQVGFIRSRCSSENTRRLINIMWTSENTPSPATAQSLEVKKAFDGVDWLYLFPTLEAFGFGRIIITWVKLLYTNPKASVTTNKIISKSFELQRGTRQGCPLSPLFFALIVEPLAATIRRDLDSTCVQVDNNSHKLMLYADDALFFITEPERSLPALHKTIDLFSKLSEC